jgi:hypothetical protein
MNDRMKKKKKREIGVDVECVEVGESECVIKCCDENVNDLYLQYSLIDPNFIIYLKLFQNQYIC